MTDRSDPRLVHRLSVFASAASLFSIAVGLLVLLGWTFHIPLLKTGLHGPKTIKANTALCFVLIGLSLWLLRKADAQPFARKLIAGIAATIVTLVGLLSEAEYLFGWNLGIDQLLFVEKQAIGSVRPGLMSPISSLCALLTGISLLALNWRARRDQWPSQLTALAAGTAAFLAIVYSFLDPSPSRIQIVPQSVLTFLVVSIGLVCARPESGLAALLTRQSTGGRWARRLFPAVALIPMLVVWGLWGSSAAGIYSEWSAPIFVTVAMSVLLTGLIAWMALVIDRSYAERRKVEQAPGISEGRSSLLLPDDAPIETLLRRRVTLALVLAVMLTGLLGCLSWYTIRYTAGEADLVAHTYNVLKTLEGTSKDVIEAVTSAQGFALTGRKSLLGHYEAARNGVGQDLDTLRRLIADNPNQQRRLEVLQQQVSAALSFAEKTVATRQRARGAFGGNEMQESERLMNTVRAPIQEMQAEETLLLNQRSQKTKAARRLTSFLALVGTLVGMGLLLLAGSAINREIGVSARARTQVNTLNAELEQRVEQRTAALQSEVAERVRAEQMLQSVLESMEEGLVAADEHGKFLIWNRAAKKIVGYGPADLPIQEWSGHYGNYLPDQTTPFPTEQLPLIRAIRGENADAEIFLRNPQHAEGVWLDVSGRPLKDENGVLRGGVVAFRDVTQAKAAAQEIRRLNEELEHRVAERTAQLEEANKELESFTYSVAHDLRAPLRHIAGFSGILMEEFGPSLDAQAQSYLQRIHEGARKMGRLVDELLNLARMGRQEPNLQQVGLNSIVKEVLGILQPEIEGRQVEWRIANLPLVEGDPTLLKQVFQNLISNSLKYSRPRPQALIEIGQTQVNGCSAIFVRDNGVGFSMKYADKLFGVFQRLHRSEDFEGTGVGLATVQRIIKKHQGRVWAEAELDKGATFYFTIGGLQPAEAKKQTIAVGA